MRRGLAIFSSLTVAALFAWLIPLSRLFDAFQPLITAESIMIAAVFVRLNRGMPTLEWKGAEPETRLKLTSQIVELAKEYARIIAIDAALLLGLVIVLIVGKMDILTWLPWEQKAAAGLVGFGCALSITRMGYVVWRDVDVVKLQKHLIDESAGRESQQEQRERAEDKIASIRSSGLRKVDVPPPKAWGE